MLHVRLYVGYLGFCVSQRIARRRPPRDTGTGVARTPAKSSRRAAHRRDCDSGNHRIFPVYFTVLGEIQHFSLSLPMAPAHVQIDDRNPLSEYTRAIGLLLEIQNSRGVDLSVLVDVLRAFSALPENKVLRPRAFEYPDRAAMEVAIAVAIDLMDVKTGTWEVCMSPDRLNFCAHFHYVVSERVAKALPVIITLYELHGMRVEAIAAYNARLPTIPGALWPPVSIEPNVPEAELYRADDRVRVLHPIDAVVGHFYEAFNHGELIDSALMVVVDFVYQMVSHHGPDQEFVPLITLLSWIR